MVEVKYKPKLSAEDRYEALGFCEALQVNVAAFVCPKFDGAEEAVLHGTTAGGRTLYLLTRDLAAADMPAEERRFTALLGKTLGV
ncbi:MAG: hypothetical protein ACRC33_21205 [Gemmataceae bacterium]